DGSWQFGFQYSNQLDARHGADGHRVLRGVHHHRPDVQLGCCEQSRRIYLQCRTAGLFVRSCYSEHSDFHRRGHPQQFSNAPSFSLTTTSLLAFTNSSTAGNAIITNSGTSAVTQFSNSSTAGNATITNTNSGFVSFNDSSTAGNANITSDSRGFASFLGSSTAGKPTPTPHFLGFPTFSHTSTPGNAPHAPHLGRSPCITTPNYDRKPTP